MKKFKTVDDVKKAYVKLKSDIYHSNNIYYKNMIAEFEMNNDKEKVFEIVASIYNGESESLDIYLDNINIIALPKKVDVSNTNATIIYNYNDDKRVQSLNFFIDAPIEIFLIDVLWCLDVGIECSEQNKIAKNSIYGNVLSDFKIYQLEIENATFFEPYFYKYSEWRNKAFSTIQKLNPKSDVLLINYDIKQYFYNYQVNFSELADFLNYENMYHFEIIEKIYKKYSILLNKFKKIHYIKDRYPLPIGLYSSRIISNIALYYYDKYIESCVSNDGYYGRYVDDMILVIPFDKSSLDIQNNLSIGNIISSTFNFLEQHEEKLLIPKKFLSLNGKENFIKLEINPSKIDIYYFEQNNENITEELFKNKILMRVSDIGYYIEEEITEKTIINDLFSYKNSKYVNKISDLKETSIDKYGLSILLTKMLNHYKNISKNDLKQESKIVPAKIINFMSNGDGIKYYQYWEKIFNLLSIFGRNYVYEYYKTMQSYIKEKLVFNLDNENNEYLNINMLQKKVIQTLLKCLSYAKEISLATRDIKNIKNKWINSMLINKNLLNDPFCLLKRDVESKYCYDIDLDKLNYLPYWISFEEIYLYEHIHSLVSHKDILTLDQIIDKYCLYNKITKSSFVVPESINADKLYENEFVNHIFDKGIYNDNRLIVLLNQLRFPKKGIKEDDNSFVDRIVENYYQHNDYDEYVIGIASLPISINEINDELKNKRSCLKLKYKRMINHILNEAINNKVDHLVFPELSIPYEWINDIIYFSKRHKIQVTFGLKFIFDTNYSTNVTQVYNCICSIYPFQVCGVYKLLYLDMREKMYYSYDEKEKFLQLNYKYNENKSNINNIVCYRGGYFTNMLCYELTSIKDRAKLVDSITNLFVPVLNKDTNYFSSIVDSTSRELYCYVSLANTSYFGDSRITAPFSTVYKDIVKLKGGQNGYLAVGSVNIKTLKENREKQFLKKDGESKYKPLPAGGKEKIIYDVIEKKDEDENIDLI